MNLCARSCACPPACAIENESVSVIPCESESERESERESESENDPFESALAS